MPSFKVPCPSCENPVLIKNPNLIGTKVECPKCKYRFKVEEPTGGIPKDEPQGIKKKKGEAATDTATKKKKTQKLVAIGAGVLAVAVLAIVGLSMMGNDKPKSSPPANTFANKGSGSGSETFQGSETEPTEPKTDDSTGKPKKKERPKSTLPYSNKEASNLIPSQTVSVLRLDVERLIQTPASPLFDRTAQDMFRRSMGFSLDDISVYYHAYVGQNRDPFGIIRLAIPMLDKDILAQMQVAPDPQTIKGRTLYAFKSNPFINGVANTFSFASLFADFYDQLPTSHQKPSANRVIGVCFYDTEHILVGDHALLTQYLQELESTGYPKPQSVVGSPPVGVTLAFAERPLYLSLDPKFKRLLIDLGAEREDPPLVVYAEQVIPGMYDPKLLKSDFQLVREVVEPVLSRTAYMGLNVNSFSGKQAIGSVQLVMVSDSAAREAVKDHLAPGLRSLTQAMTLFLGIPVEFVNFSVGEQRPGYSNPTNPGSPGSFFPPGGTPTGGIPPGSGTTLPGMLTPGAGGGSSRPIMTGPPPPPPPGMGAKGGGAPPPPINPGIGSGSSGGPPPGMGPMGYPGFPGYPGSGYPPGTGGIPGGTGSPTPIDPNQLPPSFIGLGLVDQNITITIELNWDDDIFRRLLAPRFLGVASTLKGKMSVYASDLSNHPLSQAVVKMIAATKAFPRGTAQRRLADSSRMGLPYPPQTRVSFFVELLPYFGNTGLYESVNKELSWFDEKNLPAGQSWVPQLLVPSYPQSAWRATSPFVADGLVLGGTNYVAIAGIGRDAARYDPTSETEKHLLGITGYDWGSRVEEVTDGLPYTIYLMQTPPRFSQPWIAGGGATVRGLDPNDPMRGFVHTLGTPEGKPGTFAVMGDGSIRFIPANISKDLLLAMATRAGGEKFVAERIDKEAPLVSPPWKAESEVRAEPGSVEPAEVAPEPREKK
jgi:hypothetical protein